jgi:hypothetical protein
MKKAIALFLILYAQFIFAQKQADVSLELHDGNLIKGVAQVSDVELITAYGKLNIPVTKVSHIEVGIGRDNAVIEKAKSFLKILATATTDDARKGAYADLVKLGIKAVPAFNDFFNDPKNMSEENPYTGEFSIENALTDINSAAGINSEIPIEDVITMENNYTMGGTYNFVKLDVKTEYGNLSVPKEKIKSIDVSVMNDPGKGEYTFKLVASKNISGNNNGGWLKTGIQLKAGQKFSISASGEITMASLSNNKYKPDGSSKAEGAAEWTKPYTGGGEEDYSGTGYPSYGQIVYRIGDKVGENLKAGAKFSGTAKTSGMLMLSIYETVYNAANKGMYSVKVTPSK